MRKNLAATKQISKCSEKEFDLESWSKKGEVRIMRQKQFPTYIAGGAVVAK